MQPLWTRDFILAFIANFFMSFAFYLLMPTLPIFLIQGMHASPAYAGMVMAAYVVAGLVIRPLSGFFIDRFPRKQFYVAMFAFYALCGFLYLGAVALWMVLLVRILHGIAWALLLPSGNTIAIDICPPQRRGEGIGYYGMSMNLAMALGPMMGIVLLDHLGFDAVLLATGITSLLGMMVALALKAPFHAPHPHLVLSLDRFLLKKGIPGAMAMLLLTISYGLLLAYASLYGKQHGISGTGYFFVLVSVGFLLSRLLCSNLLDKGWTVRLALIGSGLAVLGLVLLGLCPVSAVYFSTALLLGVAYGIGFSALQTWIIHRAEHSQRGTANSTYFTAFDLGVGGGLLLGGQLGGTLDCAFLVTAACALAGMGVLAKLKA